MTAIVKEKSDPIVVGASVGVIVGVVALLLLMGPGAEAALKAAQNYLTVKFGWFYVLSVAVIFFTMLYLAISRHGNIKLGPNHAKPSYSNLSWFAMLFSAGMGVGLLFFGVGEPVMHYLNPPVGQGSTPAAAKQAMFLTFFHWGLNAWAIYGIVGVALAFFSYRHNLPLTLSSAFYPLIGEKVRGPWGRAIDVFAVVATMFGVATTLGYGVIQINSGFNYLFGLPQGVGVQIVIIVVAMVFVSVSAMSGVNKGIKLLSNINMILAFLLLAFVVFLGNTTFLLKSFVENTGNYLSQFVGATFNMYAYEKQKDDWMGGWTLLYWTWWLSWSPFVGAFIARISRGRTIREFVIGVLLVPAGFTCLWMTALGDSALQLVAGGFDRLADVVNRDVSLALFVFLEQFPLSFAVSFIAASMILLFFVTSADSAAMVMDMFCSKGSDRTPAWHKLMWCVVMTVVAAGLLYAGGLAALQTMTMVAALPFTIALLGCMAGLIKALNVDSTKKATQFAHISPSGFAGGKPWQERLKTIIDHPTGDEALEFFSETVEPAMGEARAEFARNGLGAIVRRDVKNSSIELEVELKDVPNYIYGVKFIKDETPRYARRLEDSYYRAEVYLSEGGQNYDVLGWSKASLLNDVVEQYRRHMHFIRLTSG